MLPRQVISYEQLIKEGKSKKEIENLSAALRIFPTPFKGIYYVPLEIERKGAFIDKPGLVLSRAIELFLGSSQFYFSCASAEEFLGIRWQPSGKVHIVNEKLSKKISLDRRIERNESKKTYRALKIARLLSFYGKELIFHRTKDIKGCKVRQTPYGRYALKWQIKIDKRKFRCG